MAEEVDRSPPPGLSSPTASAEVVVVRKPLTRTERLVSRIGELIGEIDVDSLRQKKAAQEARLAQEKADSVRKQTADVDLSSDGQVELGGAGKVELGGEGQVELGSAGGSNELSTSSVNVAATMGARNTSDQPIYSDNAHSQGSSTTWQFFWFQNLKVLRKSLESQKK